MMIITKLYVSYFLTALIFTSNSWAASAVQKKNESDISFAERVTGFPVTPTAAENKQIARTTLLGKEMVIAFVEAPFDPERPNDHDYNVEMNLLIKEKDSSYLKTSISVCDVEGGNPTLRSFFYFNADAQADLEIVTICGWDATHKAADCNLQDEVRIFKLKGDTIEALPMDKYKSLLYEDKKPETKSDFTCQYKKFKTAADVKRLLKSKM